MTTHTKEPWRQGTRFPSRILADNANVASTALFQDEDSQTEIDLANARRIVACVNACAGIPTEALEAGALAALVAEAAEAALAKLREERQPLRVQIYPTDQETGARGPLHWEGAFTAEVIEDDEERAEVEAKLRESGVAMVGGGAMPLVLILRVGG